MDSLLPTPLPAGFRYTRYYEEFPAAIKVSSVTFAAPPSLSAESGGVIDAGITMSNAKAAVSATGESASPLPSLHQVPHVIIPTLPLVPLPLPLIVEINDGSGSAGASSRFIELPRVSVWRGSFMLFKSTGATSTSGSSHSGGGGGGSSSREKKREAKAVVDRFVLTLEAPSGDVSDTTNAPVSLDAVIARGEGGCALGAYELLGNLRLDADGIGLICSCIRSYTGAPKVRSPTRSRPSSVSRHTSSTDADAVAAATAAAATLAPRASGRVRIKSRLYDDGFVEDEGGTTTGTGIQGGRSTSGGRVETGTVGVDGTGGGGGIVSGKKRKSIEFVGHGGEGGGGEGTITGGGREGKIGSRSGK